MLHALYITTYAINAVEKLFHRIVSRFFVKESSNHEVYARKDVRKRHDQRTGADRRVVGASGMRRLRVALAYSHYRATGLGDRESVELRPTCYFRLKEALSRVTLQYYFVSKSTRQLTDREIVHNHVIRDTEELKIKECKTTETVGVLVDAVVESVFSGFFITPLDRRLCDRHESKSESLADGADQQGLDSGNAVTA